MNKDNQKGRYINDIARVIKYNSRVVLVIIFFLGLIAFASLGNKGIIQRFKLETEKKDLEEQLEAEIKKSQQLLNEINELKSSDTKIEKVAREKYGMTKDGEKIYKVIVDSTK
ncbi:MAG: septum formation initiator family protein [Bacteroidota bacterium]|nr:septum formation initiator family protein [Bacteroidota bacterium]